MTKSRFWKMPTTLAAFALALALVLTACGGEDNGGGSGSLGATMNLGGNVYTMDWNDDDRPVFTRFTGNRTILSDPRGGTGTIANGQLSFTFGRPAPENLENIGDYLEDWVDGMTVTPANAIGTFLWLETASVGTTVDGDLARENRTETATSGRREDVFFIFVNQDVTMQADRRTGTWDDNGYSGTYEIRAVNITLREGWNALRTVVELRETGPNRYSETITVSHANPGSPVRWVISEWSHGGWAEPIGELEPSGRTLPGRNGARPLFGTRR